MVVCEATECQAAHAAQWVAAVEIAAEAVVAAEGVGKDRHLRIKNRMIRSVQRPDHFFYDIHLTHALFLIVNS